LLVLDQFEEYFLYHPDESGPGTFDDELPRLAQRMNPRVHVMLSIRADALAKLDRFKGRIPGLFAGTLRIAPLDRERGREAIEEPVARYNQAHQLAADPVRFSPGLVDAVLDGVKAGAIDLETTGRGRLDVPAGPAGAAPGPGKE